MDKYEALVKKIDKFNKDRDWDQFHSEANIAKSVCIEAGELLECFQWDNENFDKDAVCDEMADVFTYIINLALRLDVDLLEVTDKKLDRNALKYPIEKAKGKINDRPNPKIVIPMLLFISHFTAPFPLH